MYPIEIGLIQRLYHFSCKRIRSPDVTRCEAKPQAECGHTSGLGAALTLLKSSPKTRRIRPLGTREVPVNSSTSSLAAGRISSSPPQSSLNLIGNCALRFFFSSPPPFQSGNMQILPLKALSTRALQIGGLLDLQKCDYLFQPCFKFLSAAPRGEGWQPSSTFSQSNSLRRRLILEYRLKNQESIAGSCDVASFL